MKTVTQAIDINDLLTRKLAENNKIIFEYIDSKLTELKDNIGLIDKLKQWNKDLFKFQVEHRV